MSEFVRNFSDILGRSDMSQKCVQYLYGLLLEGERKSIVPISLRISGSNAQALQQFIADSPWEYEFLQIALVALMQLKIQSESVGSVLILDDTSFPQKGKSSVGVARQYCGALGKIANCQVMVGWRYTAGKLQGLHLPVISRLYLPREWSTDRERLRKAKVPKYYWNFKENWRIALPSEVSSGLCESSGRFTLTESTMMSFGVRNPKYSFLTPYTSPGVLANATVSQFVIWLDFWDV